MNDGGIRALAPRIKKATALVVALLTVSRQAIKAAMSNPVDALRYE